MTQSYFMILLIGGISVLLFDALGSIASRKFKVNFKNLSIISPLIQLAFTIYAGWKIDAMAAITIGGLLALIDAIFGYKVISRFNPMLSDEEKEALDMFAEDGKPKVVFVFFLVLTGLFVGFIGSLIAKYL